jgi:RNA polymerase sigma-70 factor (ECF subfamily)
LAAHPPGTAAKASVATIKSNNFGPTERSGPVPRPSHVSESPMSRPDGRSAADYPDDNEPRDLDVGRARAVLALGGVPWHALEDGVQQVRLRLLEQRATQGKAEIRRPDAWTAVVASRVAVDWHRARGRDDGLRERLAVHWRTHPPSAGHDEVDQALDVAALLEQLTPKQRQVLLLRYFADLSVPHIAQELALPPGTVKSRLHGAERAVRALLRKDEV